MDSEFAKVSKSKRRKRQDKKRIARFRCGNEELSNKYWNKEEEKFCRICQKQEETLEHMAINCEEMRKAEKSVLELMQDDGTGDGWMRDILQKRDQRREERRARKSGERE